MDDTIAILNRIAAAEHADPASDDLTIPLAIENADLAAEIGRLRAALMPFVTAANDADGYKDNHPIGCDPCMALDGLTVGDLRRARDAHDGRKPG